MAHTSTVTAGSSTRNGSGNGLGELVADEHAPPPYAEREQGDIFVKHLPDGQTLLTHVFWVERGAPGR